MEIYWAANLKVAYQQRFTDFLNAMSKRIQVGHFRYGTPNVSKLYIDRLKAELIAYKRTGNMEHLLNIANYAFLESLCPQNKKFHFDNTVESVTRKK